MAADVRYEVWSVGKERIGDSNYEYRSVVVLVRVSEALVKSFLRGLACIDAICRQQIDYKQLQTETLKPIFSQLKAHCVDEYVGYLNGSYVMQQQVEALGRDTTTLNLYATIIETKAPLLLLSQELIECLKARRRCRIHRKVMMILKQPREVLILRTPDDWRILSLDSSQDTAPTQKQMQVLQLLIHRKAQSLALLQNLLTGKEIAMTEYNSLKDQQAELHCLLISS